MSIDGDRQFRLSAIAVCVRTMIALSIPFATIGYSNASETELFQPDLSKGNYSDVLTLTKLNPTNDVSGVQISGGGSSC